MIKLSAVRTWGERVIKNIEKVKLNTDLNLTFEGVVKKHGTPVATIFIDSGTGEIEGDVFLPKVPVNFYIIDREDGDYEEIVQAIVSEIESNAYPDFFETGDSSQYPAVVKSYEWDIFARGDKTSGKIIIVLKANIEYVGVSTR